MYYPCHVLQRLLYLCSRLLPDCKLSHSVSVSLTIIGGAGGPPLQERQFEIQGLHQSNTSYLF